MEDESGRPISPGIKNALRGNLTSYWNDIRQSGEELTNFTELRLVWKEHFRKTFETKYHWLRFCEAHWKVDHLWINYFGTWKKHHNTPEPNATANSKRRTGSSKASVLVHNSNWGSQEPMALINISSSTEASGVSAGSKHGRKEPDDSGNAPKCRKGKEREVFTPTIFHSSRPIPKRKEPPKLSKVSPFEFHSLEHR